MVKIFLAIEALSKSHAFIDDEILNNASEDEVLVEKDGKIVWHFTSYYEDGLYIFDISKCPLDLHFEITQCLADIEDIIVILREGARYDHRFYPINISINSQYYIAALKEFDSNIFTNGPKDIVTETFVEKYLKIRPGGISTKMFSPKELKKVIEEQYYQESFLWPYPELKGGENDIYIPGFCIFNPDDVNLTISLSKFTDVLYTVAFCDNKIVGVLKSSFIVDKAVPKCILQYGETISTFQGNGVFSKMLQTLDKELDKRNIWIARINMVNNIALKGWTQKTFEIIKANMNPKRFL